jgi:hypothetical protein
MTLKKRKLLLIVIVDIENIAAVAPGPVTTDLFLNGKSVQMEQLRKLAPLEHLGLPEDIANVVSFLAGLRVVGSMVRSCERMVDLYKIISIKENISLS